MDRGAWRTAVHRVEQSQTQLNAHTVSSRTNSWGFPKEIFESTVNMKLKTMGLVQPLHK